METLSTNRTRSCRRRNAGERSHHQGRKGVKDARCQAAANGGEEGQSGKETFDHGSKKLLGSSQPGSPLIPGKLPKWGRLSAEQPLHAIGHFAGQARIPDPAVQFR